MSAAVAMVLAVTVATIAPAAADDLDDLRDQQAENQQEREDLEASLEGTDKDLAATYLELEDIKQRLPIAEQELVQANEDLAAAERHRDEVQGRLDVARQQQADLEEEITQGEDDIDATNAAMGEVARTAYRGGDGLSTLSLIFGAGSAEEFAQDYSAMSSALRTQNQTLSDLENLQAVNRNRQVRLDAVEERIAELQVEAQQAVADAEEAQQRAADLVVEIKQLKADKEAKAVELEQKRAEYAEKQEELQAENDRINQEIKDEIARIAAAEKAERERQARLAAQSSNSGGGGSSSGGGGIFIKPLNRSLHVTSPYGMRWYPISGGYWFHQGVDLRSACGEAQMAAASGTVIAVRPAAGNGTHGNQIMINHGVINGSSWVTVYNHLSRFAVHVGDHVTQGQVIAYTGATGDVTGCHAHFEIWKNGSTVNPMPYIS